MLKITVVTPSLNQGPFIEKTIQSVLDQNYPDFEHLVLDGGSTDGTLEILKRYRHLRWVSEPDGGKTPALNKGFKMAKGDIIAWISSDDYYPSGIFGHIAEWFDQNLQSSVLIGRAAVVDFSGNFLFEQEEPKDPGFTFEGMIEFWKYPTLPQPSMFFRRSVFQKIGYLDERCESYMDYDFLLRLSKVYELRRSREIFAFIRVHPEAGSVKDIESGVLRKRLLKISFRYWGDSGALRFLKYLFTYMIHWPVLAWRAHYERFAFSVRKELHVHFSKDIPKERFWQLRPFFFRYPFPFIVAGFKIFIRSIQGIFRGACH